MNLSLSDNSIHITGNDTGSQSLRHFWNSHNATIGDMLRIYCCRHERGIYPWLQSRLETSFWRFYWCEGPGGVITMDGKDTSLTPDNFYIIPGGVPFSTSATRPFGQFYIHFGMNCRLVPPRQVLRLSANDPLAMGIIRNFIDGVYDPADHQKSILAVLAILSTQLLRLPAGVLTLPKEYDPRIEKALAWLECHPESPADNGELATLAGMSRNGFLRLFREQTGETPQKFSVRRRVMLAAELLQHSDMTLEQIAAAAGFCDRFHLARVFNRQMNCSPARFRRSQRGTADGE